MKKKSFYDKSWKAGDTVELIGDISKHPKGKRFKIVKIEKGRCGCGEVEPYIALKGFDKNRENIPTCFHYGCIEDEFSFSFALRKVNTRITDWRREILKGSINKPTQKRKLYK